MSLDAFVSVVAPLRDDADIVRSFVSELCEVLERTCSHYEVVLVDDGSTDGLDAQLEELLEHQECVRCVRLSRRVGEDVAIAAGLDMAIGDTIVVMRPNEDPPALVPAMLDAQRGADIVYGVRIHRRDEPWWYRLGARAFYWYARRVAHLPLPPDTTQFRCMSRQVVTALAHHRGQDRYLRLLVMRMGFRQRPFPYQPVTRRGRPTRRFGDALNLAAALIADNTVHPLRVVTWLGLIAAVANLVYGAYVLLIWMFKAEIAEGWVTLSLQNTLQFFLLALILTVLCEYVGRIFTRMHTGPSYFVLEERNSSVLLREERRNVVANAEERIGVGTPRGN